MSLTKEQCEEFWSKADRNNDGELTIQEMAAALKQYRPCNAPPDYQGPSDRDIAYMFSSIDKSGDNRVSKKEFFDEMEKPPRSETLKAYFNKYDRDRSGTLSRDEVASLVRECGCFQPGEIDQAITDIIQTADASGDGLISFQEFMAVCR